MNQNAWEPDRRENKKLRWLSKIVKDHKPYNPSYGFTCNYLQFTTWKWKLQEQACNSIHLSFSVFIGLYSSGVLEYQTLTAVQFFPILVKCLTPLNPSWFQGFIWLSLLLIVNIMIKFLLKNNNNLKPLPLHFQLLKKQK